MRIHVRSPFETFRLEARSEALSSIHPIHLDVRDHHKHIPYPLSRHRSEAVGFLEPTMLMRDGLAKCISLIISRGFLDFEVSIGADE